MDSRPTRRDLKVTATQPLIARTEASLASHSVTSGFRLLVAVSGGPDSLALAHVLQSLRGVHNFAELAVAHVNHGIRPEAVDEENVVRRYCEEWNVPIYVKRVDSIGAAKQAKRGIEETARRQRYEFFEELSKSHGFDFILTAHTANDQAETVLMHLVRGAGVRGLAGIPAKRKLGSAYLIRPWLSITRDEILEYIQACGLRPLYDKSNEELAYQRNRVRHIVMPALAEAWPERSPVRSIARVAERFRELDQFLTARVSQKRTELRVSSGLSLTGLKELHGFELHAILEAWIAETFGPFSISSRETARIAVWLASRSPVLELRRGIRLRKHGMVVNIEKNTESLYFKPVLLIRDQTATTPFGEFSLHSAAQQQISKDPLIAPFDSDSLSNHPIRVRPWQQSDRIAPFGMEGKRKLVSDVLTEAKITGERRRSYPVVEMVGNAILWVPGIRRSDIAPVTERTRDVLEVVFKPA